MTVTTPRRPGPDLSEIELDSLLKRLHLANLRRVFREAITRAEEEQWYGAGGGVLTSALASPT